MYTQKTFAENFEPMMQGMRKQSVGFNLQMIDTIKRMKTSAPIKETIAEMYSLMAFKVLEDLSDPELISTSDLLLLVNFIATEGPAINNTLSKYASKTKYESVSSLP